MMSDDSLRKCSECEHIMNKQIACPHIASKGFKPLLSDRKESEHTKKVKDKERAIKKRKKLFGEEAGNPVDVPNPKHLIKGRVIGGQESEVNKQDLTKALAKDNYAVEIAKEVLKKKK
ncbi:hypothetical protein LCGC14_1170760 [marine sediment metagenome]|uniref:Uncharacterized protein n=1 Tax=marine sediment metagenome TaxID=412755 RepID=A0A0F9PVF9_9ZZZZ